MAIALNSSRAYEYVFSTASVYSEDISNGFYTSCVRLGSSLYTAVLASVAIIAYLLLLIAKLTVMVFPHFILTSRRIIEFHRTKLTTFDIIVEFSVILIVALFVLLRKRIINQWTIFEKSVAKKSKSAAEAAPHFAFFTFSAIVYKVGWKFLIHLTSPSVLPIVTLVIPIFTTLACLRQLAKNVENKTLTSLKRQLILKRKLTLWVVLAAYHTTATGLSLIPFSSKIASIIPLSREIAAVVIIWVQLSYKFADIMFDAAIPFLKYLSKNIPSSNFGSSSGNSFISMLKMMNIINARYEGFLKSLLQEFVIVLIALFFIFSPWRVAYVGVIIVSLLFPAFKSSNVLLISNHKHEDEKSFWLEYWICWGLLWLLRCYGFKIWPSMMLLSALWLQLTLFGGATLVLSSFGSNLAAVIDRHDRMQNEKYVSIEDKSDLNESSPLTPVKAITGIEISTSNSSINSAVRKAIKNASSNPSSPSPVKLRSSIAGESMRKAIKKEERDD